MAIAFIAGGTKGGGANGATTDAANTGGANLIVLCGMEYLSGSTTISDSAGNTWTALTQQAGDNRSTRLYYCLNPTTSGTHTFTLSRTGSYPCLGYIAVSGASAYGSENGAQSLAVTTLQPGSVTPGADGALIVTGVTTSSTAHTIDGGYTRYNIDFSPGNYMGGGIAYLIQGTAGASNPSWSWTGTSGASAVIATFSAAAGGSVVGPLLRGRLTGGGILRGRLIRG
jgi:hypothetical protein